ncbi:hypothetical protein [Alkalibacterium sp. MB6]|uniref:hypothetical protein n=1 Tax=Alkalibacterium sp. MB6 TaxID=2081965 RepID=UPI00137ABDA4|nr:hypothetical protein [Alkalibacterium sp. MB6]
MKNIDDTQKSILLGMGAAFLVGIVTFLFSSDNHSTSKKAKKAMKVHKAKKYMDKLPGHKSHTQKFMDKMPGNKSHTQKVMDKFHANDMEDKFSDMSSDFMDYMSDKAKDSKKFMKKVKS